MAINMSRLVRRVYKVRSKKKRIVKKLIKKFWSNSIAPLVVKQYEDGLWKL